MKNRQISEVIKRKHASKFGRILVLTGARQTGKTTLSKKLFSGYTYISIEDPVTVDQYKQLTAQQWQKNFPEAIIDEIQKEPQLVESIKSVYDQYPEPRYILLGSSQIMLLKKIKESLAGRVNIIELFPLTFPEMLTKSWKDNVVPSFFQQLISGEKPELLPFLLDKNHAAKMGVYEHHLKFGGYPALSGTSVTEFEKYDWLKNFVKTYLERDIRDLADFQNLEPFTKTQKLMAINTSQVLNNSKMAVEAGVSGKTIQRFIEYMQISYQLILLNSWHRNQKKRLTKASKVHFLDIGVLRAVLQKRGELNGHEFETAIVSEIYKQIKTAHASASVYHLRTADGREIDLLIESEDGYYAIEIKQASTIRAVDGIHLRDVEEILDKPVIKKFVLSNDMQIKDLGYDVVAMPAVQFLT